MRVLFVSSGNSVKGISPIIKNQGDSLVDMGVDLTYFTIKGKGFKGYSNSVFKLKKVLNKNEYDIIHAHYSLSAIVASFAGAKPLVVSLMGSDVKHNNYYKYIIKFFHKFFWIKTIVKSKDMQSTLKLKALEVIPNGVNLKLFRPIDKEIALKQTKWNSSKKHILFAANPNRFEKNFSLTKNAFHLLDDENVELHCLNNVKNEEMPYYFNASDVVILTSLWEGSPNVIKEAMACNTPIVSTGVGDVIEIIGKTNGCHIVKNNETDVLEKIKVSLNFNTKTTGRNQIKQLDSRLIAKRIINLYNTILI